MVIPGRKNEPVNQTYAPASDIPERELNERAIESIKHYTKVSSFKCNSTETEELLVTFLQQKTVLLAKNLIQKLKRTNHILKRLGDLASFPGISLRKR